MAKPKPWVIGNWKMHGSYEKNSLLLEGLKAGVPTFSDINVVVCPPFVYVPEVIERLKGTPIGVGAQDVSAYQSGAYTGQISAGMLADVGAAYVLVGHSERRQYQSETDLDVAAKFEQACKAGLTPVLCVGETLAERQAGQTKTVVLRQLNAVIDQVGINAFNKALVAYEPVWAIGTGLSATAEQAEEVHATLRECLVQADKDLGIRVPLLYGGSVKPDNAKTLCSMPNINGCLVGGASLTAADFLGIIDL